jgi:hypothetical protein
MKFVLAIALAVFSGAALIGCAQKEPAPTYSYPAATPKGQFDSRPR